MLEIITHVDRPLGEAIGVKEALAMDQERFGDVRVISVREITPEQTSMGQVNGN